MNQAKGNEGMGEVMISKMVCVKSSGLKEFRGVHLVLGIGTL